MLSQLSYTPTSAFTLLRVSATVIIITHLPMNVKCFLKKFSIFFITIICTKSVFDNGKYLDHFLKFKKMCDIMIVWNGIAEYNYFDMRDRWRISVQVQVLLSLAVW